MRAVVAIFFFFYYQFHAMVEVVRCGWAEGERRNEKELGELERKKKKEEEKGKEEIESDKGESQWAGYGP